MSFDAVHDLQAAFRRLLEAFTFPGRTVDLADLAGRIGPWTGDRDVPAGLALGAATLLDQDAAWWSPAETGLEAFLREWCAAGPRSADDAGFLLLPRTDDQSLAALLDRATPGTLTDPHRGATLLVGVEDLDRGPRWTLSGPGLEHPLTRPLPDGRLWPAARARKNAEFPLGVDLAFFDAAGRVVALPRTTKLTPEKEA